MKIEIVEYSTKKVVRVIECGASKTHAERLDDDVNVNLNHSEFYTRIVN